MAEETMRKIEDYLAAHFYLRLATISPEGAPMAHTVGYVSEGVTVYFITDRNSRKVGNLLHQPAVAYTVDENYMDWREIRGIQMEGFSYLVSEPAELERVGRLFMEKFPQAREIPPNPDWVFVGIRPRTAYFLDNTKGFGHRERVELR